MDIKASHSIPYSTTILILWGHLRNVSNSAQNESTSKDLTWKKVYIKIRDFPVHIIECLHKKKTDFPVHTQDILVNCEQVIFY
jgi:hypothetical protein